MNKKTKIGTILLFTTIAIYFLFLYDKVAYQSQIGLIYGTSYSITFEYSTDSTKLAQLTQDIKKQLDDVNTSLSTFLDTSTISLINSNREHRIDKHFRHVYNTAYQVFKSTDGAFDMSVAPLVNLWGFGFRKPENHTPEPHVVDSVLKTIGMDKTSLQNTTLEKQHPYIMLDASAIAKGYAVDVIANTLKTYKINNYLIEIGGEIGCKGENPDGVPWRIGIDKPTENRNGRGENPELQTIVHLKNAYMATSGNYRQYYYKDGNKYSHTISPFSGYPVNHSLLSATVIASSCARADAFATACMVVGVEKSLEIANKEEDVEVYLIWSNLENDEYQVSYSPGFEKYFK